jgi:ATP-dependent helicase HrpB
LPVEAAIPTLRSALARGRSAVLQAPPGAGKTTVVPLALIDEAWLERRRIVMLEPRRVAARAAAHRMSSMLGEPVGTTVGFRTRTETRVGGRTRVEVVTEGVLTRRLQRDPTLEDVGLIIFDEFHERSLVGDLGLALALHSRSLVRDDLRVLVMSATLDTVAVARLLGDADVVAAPGQVFPIATHYAPPRDPRSVEAATAATVRRALAASEGDVLVFLPGTPEIHRVFDMLSRDLAADVDLVPLHGSLTSEAQDAAIAPPVAGRRRVVLATSIAETSLTIPGVRVVVDAGLARRPRFSPRTGMTRLETVRVSRATADQRRGRAGRTAPGICYRLWHEHEELVPSALPEIVEADLAPLALDLAAAGIQDPSMLQWLDPPAPGPFAGARELLVELGLVTIDGRLTADGTRASTLPLHPRLAHMIVRAQASGTAATAGDIAALLAERDVLRAEGLAADPDIRVRLEILDAARRHSGGSAPPGHSIDRAALQRVLRESDRLSRAMELWTGQSASESSAGDVGSLLATAYPDRVGIARRGDRGRYVLRAGNEITIDPASSLAGDEFIVVAELDGKGPVSRAYLAAPIERAAVESQFAVQVVVKRVVEWSARDEAVVAREQRRLGAIVLDEHDVRADPTDVASALMHALLDRGVLDNGELRAELARFELVRRLRPTEWPQVTMATLRLTADAWLLPHFVGMRRLVDAEKLDWTAAILSLIDGRQRKLLDELAPTHLVVPTGSRIRIDYSDPASPTLSVRIQELFGLRDTPRVGGGVVPITLHLLSPANRPVQVTRDLAGFWKNSYFDVRKELRGRYPRHPWPDDPLSAAPTRRVKPR